MCQHNVYTNDSRNPHNHLKTLTVICLPFMTTHYLHHSTIYSVLVLCSNQKANTTLIVLYDKRIMISNANK